MIAGRSGSFPTLASLHGISAPHLSDSVHASSFSVETSPETADMPVPGTIPIPFSVVKGVSIGSNMANA
jgi:hypothetical protein